MLPWLAEASLGDVLGLPFQVALGILTFVLTWHFVLIKREAPEVAERL